MDDMTKVPTGVYAWPVALMILMFPAIALINA